MHSSNPLVSVIIPVYNGADFVTDAINSALAQTYKRLEVIVIDDGSKDNTAEKLKAFGDRIVWRSIPNQGPANARNQGMKLAQGDFFAFLDHDDVWFENKLAVQLDGFAQYPEVGFCCCNFQQRRGANNPLADQFSGLRYRGIPLDRPSDKHPFALMMRENFVGTASNVVIRKTVAEKVGWFNVKYVNAQEFEFWVRCSLVTPFLILSQVLMEKRWHTTNWSGNTMRSFTFQKMLIADTIRNNYQYLQDHGFLDRAYLTLAMKNYTLGDIYFEEKKVRTAFSLYWEGLRTSASLHNLILFLGVTFRKSVRLLSGGLISRKSIKRIFDTRP